MRRLGLVIATLICAGLSVLISAWPDLQQLRIGKNWSVTRLDQSQGDLQGVRVFVDQARAVILPSTPDRALVYLRLGLQGDLAVRQRWLSCDLSLTDDSGRKWLPLTNALGSQVVQLFDPPDRYGRACSQSLAMASDDGAAVFSDNPFLIPSEMLGRLRLEFSGMMTRPEALSMPIRPVLQPPPGP